MRFATLRRFSKPDLGVTLSRKVALIMGQSWAAKGARKGVCGPFFVTEFRTVNRGTLCFQVRILPIRIPAGDLEAWNKELAVAFFGQCADFWRRAILRMKRTATQPVAPGTNARCPVARRP